MPWTFWDLVQELCVAIVAVQLLAWIINNICRIRIMIDDGRR